MKVKLKLDANQLKKLALAHVEKAVFAVIAVVALMLVFKSFGLPKFTKKPDDLQNSTSRAQQTLRTTEGEARELVRTELKPREFLTIANKNTEKFLPDGYAWSNVKPRVYAAGSKRKEPVYVAVENLRAYADRGVFATRGGFSPAPANVDGDAIPLDQPAADGKAPADEKKPAADEVVARERTRRPATRTARGRREEEPPRMGIGMGSAPVNNGEGLTYVVVTGTVPYAKQLKAFREAFGTAEYRTTEDEKPNYLAMTVERAEIIPGVADKDLKWTKVSGSATPSTMTKERLSSMSDPLSDPKFQHSLLTEQLFSLTQGEWNPDAIVPEEFRLKDVAAAAPAGAAPAAVEPVAADGIEPDIRPDAPRAGGMGQGGMGGGVRRFGGAAPNPAGGMGGGMRLGGGGGMGMGNRRPIGMGNANGELPEKYMFRYFDFSADPGKRYRYRVRLFLTNPNLNVDPRYLEADTLAQRDFRYTDPSDPTDPVTVPNDGSLIAGTYSPPLGPNEASATVVLTQFMPQGGRTAFKELAKLVRGQIANEESDEAMVQDPATGELQPVYEPVKFRSNLMLLDVSPAERNKPADVLLLNGEGKLVVVSAVAEQQRFTEVLTKLRTKPKPAEKEKDKDKKRERDPKPKQDDAFGGNFGN